MKRTPMLAFALLLLASCSDPQIGDKCENGSDCAGGQYCARIAVCTASCEDAVSCPVGARCVTVDQRAVCLRSCAMPADCNAGETCALATGDAPGTGPGGVCRIEHPLDPPP